jgi:hypothetical protein
MNGAQLFGHVCGDNSDINSGITVAHHVGSITLRMDQFPHSFQNTVVAYSAAGLVICAWKACGTNFAASFPSELLSLIYK